MNIDRRWGCDALFGWLAILLVVVVVASVGSHMPSRFRHRSVLPVHRGEPGEAVAAKSVP